jgi:hypothetical protein
LTAKGSDGISNASSASFIAGQLQHHRRPCGLLNAVPGKVLINSSPTWQQLVAGDMAVKINPLEVVHVQQHQRAATFVLSNRPSISRRRGAVGRPVV